MAREIMKIYALISQNLDLVPETDINVLFNEKIYCQMFKIMFPFLEKDIDDISKERNPSGEKIQGLIEVLSFPVLTMDLSHINGDAISKGDLRHLSNFLQILNELSKLFKAQNTWPNSDPTSPPRSEYSCQDDRSNQSAPVVRDSNRGPQQMNNKHHPYQHEEYEDDEEHDLVQQSAQEYSQQSLNEDESGKQIHRNKSIKDLQDQQWQQQPYHKEVVNSKENQMKALEGNIVPVTQMQHRIITTDPHVATKKKQQQKKHIQGSQQMSQQQQTKQQIEQQLEELSDVDVEFLNEIDVDEIAQLPEDHEIKQKYQREYQKLELYRMLEHNNEGNFDDIMDIQIGIVKNALEKMKSNPPLDEKETIDQIIRKRNDYKLFLKDYLKTYNHKQSKMAQSKAKPINQQKKLVKVKKDQEDLKKELENQHMSMYYKLRDEKLNYLRKIHRIIFELEKRKIIDEKKDHLQTRRQQNIVARNALTSIENAYNDKINMLKEKLTNERKDRHVSSVAQRDLLSKLERELKSDKLKQIDDLKELWKQERGRFDHLIKDDGELEKKILQIYKKY